MINDCNGTTATHCRPTLFSRCGVLAGLSAIAGSAALCVPYARAKDAPEKDIVKFGFIKLTDCAPLVIAYEKKFFDDEGLLVTLEAQANWKVLLDRVIDGQLDGAHMLAGQPLGATLEIGTKAPIVTALSLALNGNVITVSNTVWEEMKQHVPHLDGKPVKDPRRKRQGFRDNNQHLCKQGSLRLASLLKAMRLDRAAEDLRRDFVTSCAGEIALFPALPAPEATLHAEKPPTERPGTHTLEPRDDLRNRVAGRKGAKEMDMIGTHLHCLDRNVIRLRNIGTELLYSPLHRTLQHVASVRGRPDHVGERLVDGRGGVAGPCRPCTPKLLRAGGIEPPALTLIPPRRKQRGSLSGFRAMTLYRLSVQTTVTAVSGQARLYAICRATLPGKQFSPSGRPARTRGEP